MVVDDTSETDESAQAIAELTKDLETSQHNFAVVNGELQSSEAQVQHLRKLLQHQKGQAAKLLESNEELNSQIVAAKQEGETRLAEERESLTAGFTATITALQQQAERQREDFAEITDRLRESEVKVAEVGKHLVKLSRVKTGLESELRKGAEEAEREKRLIQATWRAKCIGLDSQYQQGLEDARAGFESEKRSLELLAFDAFAAFVGPIQRIDDREFKLLIRRVKEEVDRLSAAECEIRNLLGAGDSQSLSDVVAQFVIDHES
jgi:chromosome segregation ATPase